jgi:hypothetical protein
LIGSNISSSITNHTFKKSTPSSIKQFVDGNDAKWGTRAYEEEVEQKNKTTSAKNHDARLLKGH